MSDHGTIRTIWTPQEVDALNRYQRDERFHAFTCPDHSQQQPLIATVRGWICVYCDYTQEWAHGFMFEELPKQ